MSLSKIWQRILFSRCLALNHIQSPMTHLDNLVLNSIQQPHGYQFYIAFQCFLHVFRETLPKPPRFLKSSNSNHFNRQPPPFFAVIFRCLQHSGAAVVASGWNCPPPLLESITGRPTLRSAPGARKFSPSLWKYHQEACNSQARLDLSIWCGLRLATLVVENGFENDKYWKSRCRMFL